jgi:hypothetical protein
LLLILCLISAFDKDGGISNAIVIKEIFVVNAGFILTIKSPAQL